MGWSISISLYSIRIAISLIKIFPLVRDKSTTNVIEKIKTKLEKVNEKMQVVSTEMYQKAVQEQAAKTAKTEKKTEKKGKEKVVDADFKEKKK